MILCPLVRGGGGGGAGPWGGRGVGRARGGWKGGVVLEGRWQAGGSGDADLAS